MALIKLSDDYIAWQNTLTSILNKHGRTPANVSGWVGTTPAVGDIATSTSMDNIKNNIIKSTAALCHVPTIGSLDIGNTAQGQIIGLATKTKIESQLSSMAGVCHHNSDHSDYDDYNDNSDYGGHLGGSGDCYDDSGVAMYIGSGG